MRADWIHSARATYHPTGAQFEIERNQLHVFYICLNWMKQFQLNAFNSNASVQSIKHLYGTPPYYSADQSQINTQLKCGRLLAAPNVCAVAEPKIYVPLPRMFAIQSYAFFEPPWLLFLASRINFNEIKNEEWLPSHRISHIAYFLWLWRHMLAAWNSIIHALYSVVCIHVLAASHTWTNSTLTYAMNIHYRTSRMTNKEDLERNECMFDTLKLRHRHRDTHSSFSMTLGCILWISNGNGIPSY